MRCRPVASSGRSFLGELSDHGESRKRKNGPTGVSPAGQEDLYLKELVRYIHLNPLRAGIVGELKKLDSYFYCGHSALMGKTEHGFQDVAYILNLFGGKIPAGSTFTSLEFPLVSYAPAQ